MASPMTDGYRSAFPLEPSMLITGPVGSGRTSALAMMARHAHRVSPVRFVAFLSMEGDFQAVPDTANNVVVNDEGTLFRIVEIAPPGALILVDAIHWFFEAAETTSYLIDRCAERGYTLAMSLQQQRPPASRSARVEAKAPELSSVLDRFQARWQVNAMVATCTKGLYVNQKVRVEKRIRSAGDR